MAFLCHISIFAIHFSIGDKSRLSFFSEGSFEIFLEFFVVDFKVFYAYPFDFFFVRLIVKDSLWVVSQEIECNKGGEASIGVDSEVNILRFGNVFGQNKPCIPDFKPLIALVVVRALGGVGDEYLPCSLIAAKGDITWENYPKKTARKVLRFFPFKLYFYRFIGDYVDLFFEVKFLLFKSREGLEPLLEVRELEVNFVSGLDSCHFVLVPVYSHISKGTQFCVNVRVLAYLGLLCIHSKVELWVVLFLVHKKAFFIVNGPPTC